jgi:multicomponent Na+:H+ antiporter subunit E
MGNNVRVTRALARAAAIRAALFGLAWVVLSGASSSYWGFALLVIVAATVTSLYMQPAGAWRWTLAGLLRFVPYFAWQSIRGGLDVSRRAFHPRLPVQPDIISYRMRLPQGPQRVFFVNSVNLQPGSAVIEIDGDLLQVHALDVSLPIEENLSALEERVAALFGVTLSPSA